MRADPRQSPPVTKLASKRARWAVGLGAAAGLGVAALYASISGDRRTAARREDAGREGFDRVARSYPTLPDVTAPGAVAGGAAAPTKESETERAAHVASLIAAWRAAILQRDADMVVQLDLTFRETPDRYAAALLENARTDSNERVRAFSTRTLGKLGRANLAPSFGQLLADASPYVRQNAAWALGELASVPEGRAATRSTLAELRRARSRDPANDVRSAARDALTRLE